MDRGKSAITKKIKELNKILQIYGVPTLSEKLVGIPTGECVHRFGKALEDFVDAGYEYALPEELIDFYNNVFADETPEDASTDTISYKERRKALAILEKNIADDLTELEKTTVEEIILLRKRLKTFGKRHSGCVSKKYVDENRKPIIESISRIVLDNLDKSFTDQLKLLQQAFPDKKETTLHSYLKAVRSYGFAFVRVLFEKKLEQNIKRIQKGEIE